MISPSQTHYTKTNTPTEPTTMSYLDDLNLEQRQAVETTDGPILIIAGAGTGKTKAITSKIAYLLLEKKIKPEQLLALTFTEKAAMEMEERVDLIMPMGYERLWIHTFHAFADRILRKEAVALGLDPEYKLFSRAENWLFVRRNLFNFPLDYYRPLGNPTRFIHALLSLFSRAKDELITPDDYLEFAAQFETHLKNGTLPPGFDEKAVLAEEALKTRELATVYNAYQNELIKEGSMDFGDLLYHTYQLFSQKKSILAKYQDQFRYILVDEFQDTNFAQNAIVQMLAGKYRNITVCGDDDQSIYKFRGASISNILQFKQDFPDAKTFVLTNNYRTTQPILDAAYNVIQNNNPERLEVREKIDKHLISKREDVKNIAPELLISSHEYEEADNVIKKIVELALHEGRQYRDFAILARANEHIRVFVDALRLAGIPYQILGKKGLYSEGLIKNLLSYIRFLSDPKDSTSMLQLLKIPIFGIPAKAFPPLLNYGKRFSCTLFETLLNVDSIEDIGEKTKEHVHALTALIEQHQQQTKLLPVSQLFYNIIMDSGILKELLEDEDVNANAILNLNRYYQTLREFESISADTSVFSYVEYVDMMIEAGDDPKTAEMIEDRNAVKLITVHSSKGLEFPIVFLVSMINQRFPGKNRSDAIELPNALVKEIIPEGEVHIQEERRLFYVGVTRARDRLFLTFSNYYGGSGTKRKPSIFVEELFGKEEVAALIEEQTDSSFTGGKSQKSIASDDEIDWQKLLPRYFSYSQLETFKVCPLQYKYSYMYRLPVPPAHPLTFGQSIHRTLKDFYDRILIGQDEPTLEFFLQRYEKNFDREGFLALSHLEEHRDLGKTMLEKFFNDNRHNFGSPFYLEKEFVYKITPDHALKGFLDRVDLYPDGRIEIIDYKTGELKDLEKKKKEAEKNMQLAIYALVGHEVFNWDLDKMTLSLYFLAAGEKISVTKTADQLEKTKADVVKTIEAIKVSEFLPEKNFFCSSCAYQKICPLW
ncbi:MAG: ATP-dependent DNA helicase [bacterium]